MAGGLAAFQLLWIILVTDAVAALALGMELPEQSIMQRSPRHPASW
jgi:magnesium-transporting ATPase (P-type)